jgi:uncharacterized protein YjbJ (UPF0337 family)
MINKDELQGKAKQLSGALKETWGKLTDDDLKLYEGHREKFLGKVQETYGITKEEVEKQIASLEDNHARAKKDAA